MMTSRILHSAFGISVWAVACLVLAPAGSRAGQPTLQEQLSAVISRADGRVGVAARDLGTGRQVVVNADGRYPMQSVYKFPLAMAVLARVDRRELSLDQVIHIDKAQLLPDTWSPIRDAHPGTGADLTLAELLRYVVSASDNNGCDALFRLMGGTAAVERDVHAFGVRDIAFAATEEEMHRDPRAQFTNWARPTALVDLLERFDRGPALSAASRKFLWKLLVETTTGPNRLRGRLPDGIVVGHKTGSSGKDERGVSAAVNDVGILALPDGRRVAIAVFVTGSKAPDEASEGVIADIAALVARHALEGGTFDPQAGRGPARAGVSQIEWLAGNWIGKQGDATVEERWTPPAGGAMLAVSRTVAGGRMTAFEFLRIVERDGGLVYVAQPNGRPPVEFVLTEVGPGVAAFENPAHDFPQTIRYALQADGTLEAQVGAPGRKTITFRFGRADRRP
jgi:beta-lactamase class A